MDQDLIETTMRLLKEKVGEKGMPLHPKYRWGGFVDALDKIQLEKISSNKIPSTSRNP